MSDRGKSDFGWRARHLRVDTIVRLRWLAIVGQISAVLAVEVGLGFKVPINALLAAITLSACLNAALRLGFPRTHRFSDGPAAALLGFDILQLGALLFLTGGIENPFVFLALAPVMISAVSLPRSLTVMLLGLMIAMAVLLMRFHMPLPWREEQVFILPFMYQVGLLVALALGGAFVCTYLTRVSEEARRLADALAATEFALVREQHLSQIDGLAAAAAHELGTPLATITLVVKDMLRRPEQIVREDVETLSQQTARCRDILSTLTSLGSDGVSVFDAMSLGVLLEDAIAPHRNFGVVVDVSLQGIGPEPRCRRNPGLLYGLGNLIENAVDFAQTRVTITASWTATTLSVGIADDGAGFAAGVLSQAGEPYISTRGVAEDGGGGLGLGLFIAKTLLERSGASLGLENAVPPGHGARVTIEWPRTAFEQGVDAVSVASMGSASAKTSKHESPAPA